MMRKIALVASVMFLLSGARPSFPADNGTPSAKTKGANKAGKTLDAIKLPVKPETADNATPVTVYGKSDAGLVTSQPEKTEGANNSAPKAGADEKNPSTGDVAKPVTVNDKGEADSASAEKAETTDDSAAKAKSVEKKPSADPKVASKKYPKKPAKEVKKDKDAPDATDSGEVKIEEEAKTGKGEKDKATISMNFSGMDLPVLIKFMAESTGKNFIITDKVAGKVTIISPKKLTKDEAYKVFESILAVHGFSAVQSGKVIKVVPISDARLLGGTMEKYNSPPAETRDQMVTQLIPLKYISADNMVNAIRPLISPTSYVAAYAPTNTIIIVELTSNMERLFSIISKLDVEGKETGITIISVKHASAKDISSKVGTLLAKEIQKQPLNASEAANALITDERLNSIIVLGTDLFTNKVRFIVSQLDVESPPGRQEIHVVYLNNAVAEDLTKVLNNILTAEQKRAAPAGGVPQDLATVTADKATNSLIITASQEQFVGIKKVLAKLDIQRKQVFVEAAIFEIRQTKQNQFGVEWRSTQNFNTGVTGNPQIIGGTSFSNGNLAAMSANPLAASAGAGLVVGAVDGTVTVGGSTYANIGALVSALASDTNVNVLSTPNLLTTDNEEAKLFVGQNVPFLQSSAQTTGGLPVVNVQRQDVGTTLKITPQISENNYVRLKIYTETSSVSPTQIAKAQDIITFKRTTDTVAIVKDSQNVAIGGLIQDSLVEIENKVPLLGDIPILGWLFKTKGTQVEKTNLLIFLTPHIIRTTDMMKDISEKNQEILDEVSHGKARKPGMSGYGIGDTNRDWEDVITVHPGAEPGNPRLK
ncbi:MAG: type II secretion system secretin GspD [Nitrospinae bacterium]|nr:type II secretion system secretin GspD [Nitrospinota bacterium]